MPVEVLPEAKVLAQSTVTAARNVAKNPIKLQILLTIIDAQVWEKSCIVACNKQRRGVEAPCLMSQHVGTLHVSVVGDNETLLKLVVICAMDLLEQLDCFRARSGAHV